MLSMTVRPNKIKISEGVYKKKVRDWKKKWPKLKIISWKCS